VRSRSLLRQALFNKEKGERKKMSNSETRPWPVDIEALQKGSRINPEAIEEWSGVPRSSRDYPMQVLKLRSHIESKLPEDWTLVSESDGIRILPDEEASPYLAKSQKQRVRGLYRDHRRLSAVDQTQVQDRNSHDRRLLVSSFITSALSNVRKQIRLLPHKSSK
jgi:hypothetical protein